MTVSRAAQGHLAMLVFSALVGGSFALGVRVADQIAPPAINAARFGIAALIIGAAALATTGLPRSAARAPWRYLVLGGLFATYFVLQFEGLKTATSVSASAVFTLTPAMAALVAIPLLGQWPTLRIVMALAVGAAGALWVIFRGDISAAIAFDIGSGETIYLWGCLAHAIYTPMVRRLNRGEPAVVFTFGMLVAGCALLTIYGWGDIRATDWAALPSIVWITLIYLATFSSAATFVLLQFATLRLPSSKVMAYTYLTPSWVIGWELALGGAAPPALILIGIALSVLALVALLGRDAE